MALTALGVSVLALLLAFGSALFAWRAVDQAKDAKSFALGNRPATIAPPPNPSGAAPATSAPASNLPSELPSGIDDVPRSPGEAPVLTEQTVYEPKYQKQPMVLQAACGRAMYADLDEPRAKNDDDQAEISLSTSCSSNQPMLRLMDGVEGSEDARPGMTPKECADKIRSALVGRDAPIPVRKGTALCITTSYQDARERRDQWRMILMQVVGVSNDGAATVELSAWNIPD
ncbi:hypothetical protein ACN261_07260 [Micromonospora sp. WMMD723]|uniref:hypothetical protein n=1 Tax=Micromonospora sp. WMMD723 TaxID=3403465 RepID=UPI003CEAAA1C